MGAPVRTVIDKAGRVFAGRSDTLANIVPSREDWTFAEGIFREFSTKEGAGRIATEVALAHLAACLRLFRPKRVLELGAGIGTITTLLLNHPAGVQTVIATEDNTFCLDALEKNLPRSGRDRLRIVTSLADLEALEGSYDLAICDGGFGATEQYRGVGSQTICFFEGHRGFHRRLLQQYLEPEGLRFEPANYPSRGYKMIYRSRRWQLFGLLLPKIKIKRKKGCWIGAVEKT